MPASALAEHYFSLGAALPPSQTGPNAQSWLLFMEGAYRTWRGQRQRALEVLDRSLAICLDLKFYRRADEVRCARAAVDIFAGSHLLAHDFLQAAEAEAAARDNRRMSLTVVIQQLEGVLLRREAGAAGNLLARAYRLFDAYGRTGHIWLFGVEAALMWLEGDRERATALVERACDMIAEGRPIHNYCINAYLRLAETAVDLFRTAPTAVERQRWGRRAEGACKMVESSARVFPIARPGAALQRGRLEVLSGRSRAARERWRSALALAGKLELPYHEARLHEALASSLPETDPRGSGMIRRQRGSTSSFSYRAAAPVASRLSSK